MYLDNLTRHEQESLENSGIYRVARIHASSKTWLATDTHFVSHDRERLIEITNAVNQLARDRGWPMDVIDHPYFVWPSSEPL